MDQQRTIPELPRLSPGVQLLQAPERAIGPLHALVLDHLLLDGGDAVWIDAHNHATSIHLADVAPTSRVLDRVHVARGFTPYQHRSLVRDASERIDEATSVIVAPAVDGLYRTEDVRGAEPREMLLQTLSRLARYARDAEVPVLTTRFADDAFSAPVETLAADVLTVEKTAFGPRFTSDDFETLVYQGDGATRQTTLSYWAQILEARRPRYEASEQHPSPSPAWS
ncbi:MAG: hypothetical protein ABEJ48_09475 [Halobacteriales archaeon]